MLTHDVPVTSTAWPPSRAARTSLRDALAAGTLGAHFQPIFRLSDGALLGVEALMRAPATSPWPTPDALFRAARVEGLETELELAAVHAAVQGFARLGIDGCLFLNLSASALIAVHAQREARLRALHALGLAPRQLVIELTEGSREPTADEVRESLEFVRSLGGAIALDDYGTGHANLNAWLMFRPDYVKIDRQFVHGVSRQPIAFEALRALVSLSDATGTHLIAEGIEDEEDLAIVRDLGIRYGQGFLLARPQADPARTPSDRALRTMGSRMIAVFPERVHASSRESAIGHLIVSTPQVDADTPNDQVLKVFNAHPSVAVLPVLREGTAVGLLNRRVFMDKYAMPYFREVYGKRACTSFIERPPIALDKRASIDEVAEMLASREQQWLADGVVVNDGETFVGIVTAEQIVRALTEVRVAAARYANPLTFLPGSVPIQRHIERLLANREGFVACYCDLNHFKAFNDQFGYARGDRMLKLVAHVLTETSQHGIDFIGHVGGDDFIALFQSDDWTDRVLAALDRFDEESRALYDAQSLADGGFHGEDRDGQPRVFPLVGIATGVVAIPRGSSMTVDQVVALASKAKRGSKRSSARYFVLDAQPLEVQPPEAA